MAFFFFFFKKEKLFTDLLDVCIELPENQNGRAQRQQVTAQISTTTTSTTIASTTSGAAVSSVNVSSSAGVFTSSSTVRASATAGLTQSSSSSQAAPPSFSSLLCAMGGPAAEHGAVEPVSLSLSSSLYLSSNNGPNNSLFPKTNSSSQDHHSRHYSAVAAQPALSATALLQKAAQIGATTSGSSFLRGLGLAMPPQNSSEVQDSNTSSNASSTTKWLSQVIKPENNNPPPPAILGLGLPYSDSSSAVTNLMLGGGPATMFGGKPTTLDFLGLGMGPDGASPEGFSAYLNSMGGGGLEVAAAAASSFGDVNMSGNSWDDSSHDRKPSLL